MHTDEREAAIGARVFAELEAERLGRPEPDEVAKLEAAGFSRRQAETIAAKSYWFLRAFLTETAGGTGPRRMPTWVASELEALYRRGGFPEPQIEALVDADAVLWTACFRDSFVREADAEDDDGPAAAPFPFRALGRGGSR